MMLDEDEIFHATSEGFIYLSNIERSAVESMRFTVGETAISAILESLYRDQQHAAIARFIHHEIVAERERVAFIHLQGPLKSRVI